MSPAMLACGLVFCLVFSLVYSACTSRYRTSLYFVEETRKRRVVIREAFYVNGLGVSSAFSSDYVTPMAGTLGAVAFSVRQSGEVNAEPSNTSGRRADVDYRLIAPFPEDLIVGLLPLTNRAFVRRMSFENEDESWRTYLFSAGEMKIDSMKKTDWFTTIAATFRNQNGDSVRIEGQIRMKKRDRFAFKETLYERGR